MSTSTPAPRLPPVLRPEHPPVRALAGFADRFADEVLGDTDGRVLTGVTLATSDLHPGDVFVGVAGANRHGADFARAAAEAGAVAVVTDREGAAIAAQSGLPVIVVADPRARLGAMAAWVYGTGAGDSLPLLLGTTGTNGKTSVSHLAEGMLRQLGVVTGLSSTAERHIAGEVIVSRLTTPEASEFHALLALMRERGVQAVAVEVSAQALSRRRLDGVVFDVAAFTNLSHDHLDDYADMDAYLEAKLTLFTPERARQAVISLDSPAGSIVAARCEVPSVTVGTPAIAADPARAAEADWTVEILDEAPDGTRFAVSGPPGRLVTTVPVIGRHMAANAGQAIAMLVAAGVEWPDLVGALEDGRIQAYLPGRTERVSGGGRTGGVRGFRALARRVREDARRGAARHRRPGPHAGRRGRRPRCD